MNLKSYLEDTGNPHRLKAIELARALGVSQVVISQWTTGVRRVPVERCIQLEKATDGAVRCEDCRPDVEWSVLRGKPKPRQRARKEAA